jgi:hypothetical protein
MDSQRLAGILGAVVALLVIASVVIYGPRPGNGPKQAEKTQAPQAPVVAPPPVRGPVIREVPN